MKKLLPFLLFSLMSSFVFSQANEDQVWAKVEALNKAVFETKDSVAMKALVSDKVTYGHSAGNLEDKRLMVTNAATAKIVYKNLTMEKVSSTPVNESVVVRYILRATSVDERGTESPLNISILQVWSKERGDSKLFARQAIRVNPR